MPATTAEIERALRRQVGAAVEQLGTALTLREAGRPDLCLLALENSRRSITDYMDVLAAWLGDDCPEAWRKTPAARASILEP